MTTASFLQLRLVFAEYPKITPLGAYPATFRVGILNSNATERGMVMRQKIAELIRRIKRAIRRLDAATGMFDAER